MNAVTSSATEGGAYSEFPSAIAQLARLSNDILEAGEAEFKRNADIPAAHRHDQERANVERQKAVDLSLLHLFPTSIAEAAAQIVVAGGYIEGFEADLRPAVGDIHRAVSRAIDNVATFLADAAGGDIGQNFGDEVARLFDLSRQRATPAAPPLSALLPSPDQAIVAAFEEWKKATAFGYIDDDDVTDEEQDAATARAVAAETIIRDATPRTPAGIAAKLLICMPRLDESRWVERSIVSDQVQRVFERRTELESWVAGCVIQSIDALQKMSAPPAKPIIAPLDDGEMWKVLIANYEAATAQLTPALAALNRAETAWHELTTDKKADSPEEAAVRAAEEEVARISDTIVDPTIEDIDSTHPPTLEALAQKVRILSKEGVVDSEIIIADILEFLA